MTNEGVQLALNTFLDEFCAAFDLPKPDKLHVKGKIRSRPPNIYRKTGWLLSFDDVWPTQSGSGPATEHGFGSWVERGEGWISLIKITPHDRVSHFEEVYETVVRSCAGLVAARLHSALSEQIRDRTLKRGPGETLRPLDPEHVTMAESLFREEMDAEIRDFLNESSAAKQLSKMCFEGRLMDARIFPRLSRFGLSNMFHNRAYLRQD